MSSKRSRRRSIINDLFGDSFFGEQNAFFDESLEGGYSISVVQTSKGAKVKAKVGKDTNVEAFKKQLQQQYPNAEIEIEGGKKESLIREISTKSLKKERSEKQSDEHSS